MSMTNEQAKKCAEAARSHFKRDEEIERLSAENSLYRKALAAIWNRIPATIGTEPMICSGLLGDISNLAIDALALKTPQEPPTTGGGT